MKKTLLFFSLIVSYTLSAQEEGQNAEVAVPIQNENWYASPWLWIVGAALFILLLVALTKEKKEA